MLKCNSRQLLDEKEGDKQNENVDFLSKHLKTQLKANQDRLHVSLATHQTFPFLISHILPYFRNITNNSHNRFYTRETLEFYLMKKKIIIENLSLSK